MFVQKFTLIVPRIPKVTVQRRFRRTIETLQRARIFKADYCLKVHNAPLKLALPISGEVTLKEHWLHFRLFVSQKFEFIVSARRIRLIILIISQIGNGKI